MTNNSNDEIFKNAKEAYSFLNNKQSLNLPEMFDALTPEQQDFFMDFFEACKEVEYETMLAQQQECTDEFITEVAEQLGTAGENTIENILYAKNMKVVYDN